MALTLQQKSDARRFAGYSMVGELTVDETRDVAWGFGAGQLQTLARRLETLQAAEEATVVNVYLARLATLEDAIPAVGDNLDTEAAAVWTHNKNEFADRLALYNYWRRQFCNFLGVEPGPGLGDGVLRVRRA